MGGGGGGPACGVAPPHRIFPLIRFVVAPGIRPPGARREKPSFIPTRGLIWPSAWPTFSPPGCCSGGIAPSWTTINGGRRGAGRVRLEAGVRRLNLQICKFANLQIHKSGRATAFMTVRRRSEITETFRRPEGKEFFRALPWPSLFFQTPCPSPIASLYPSGRPEKPGKMAGGGGGPACGVAPPHRIFPLIRFVVAPGVRPPGARRETFHLFRNGALRGLRPVARRPAILFRALMPIARCPAITVPRPH